MRSFSVTRGRFITVVWMEPTYSPMIPRAMSCTDPRKKRPSATGANPDGETRPEDELVHEVEDAGDKAHKSGNEAAEDDQAQRHLGKIGDAQHRQVVKRVEVIFGDAPLAAAFVIEDPGDGQSKLGNHAAEIRKGVAEVVADVLDYGAIVEPEAGKMLQHLDVGEASHEPVVCRPYGEHKSALVGGVLDGRHDRKALFPLANHLGKELRRVLEVGREAPHGVALSLQQSVHAGAVGAEVPRVEDDLDAGVFCSHGPQLFDRAILRSVVDEEVFEAVLRKFSSQRENAPMQLAHIVHLVVAGRQNGDEPTAHRAPLGSTLRLLRGIGVGRMVIRPKSNTAFVSTRRRMDPIKAT